MNKLKLNKTMHLVNVYPFSLAVEYIAVTFSINGALIKLHNVLGQRACFVRKYILNLSQFL